MEHPTKYAEVKCKRLRAIRPALRKATEDVDARARLEFYAYYANFRRVNHLFLSS